MTETVIIAMIVAIPPTILAVAALISQARTRVDIKDLHILVNDRLSQLISKSEKLAHEKGKAEQRAETKAEDDAKTK